MEVKLEIVEARNIAVNAECKGSMFVRFYLDNNIAVDSKEVEASSKPQWREPFCLECGGGRGINEILSAIQSEMIVFEVRWRRRTGKVFGGKVFGGVKSKVVGRIEIPWKELLASPSLSAHDCFPLYSSIFTQHPPPTLQLALSLTIPGFSAAQACKYKKEEISLGSRRIREGEIIRCGLQGREMNSLGRRVKNLEREDCECRGLICMAGHVS